MPSFPRCPEHGIRACPCQCTHRHPGDVASVDAALVDARAHVARLEQLRARVLRLPQSAPPRRNLTRAEKQRMRGYPAWAMDAPVTVPASVPVGSLRDFGEVDGEDD